MTPTHAKPSLYAYYFFELKEIAKEFGYNLVLHGSLARDLDLIAIPWVDNPKPELELIHALSRYIVGAQAAEGHESSIYLISKLPGGRTSYVINVNRSGYRRDNKGDLKEPIEYTPDPEYYIDISVTPLVCQKPNGTMNPTSTTQNPPE